MNATILLTIPKPIELDTSFGYLIGLLIGLFILGYLIYSLIKPEKF
jgi:K+-transporting ATPase KdpF subunit